MHDTARETGRKFFETYGRDSGLVVDLGSLDVNGTLRGFVPPGMDYCGVDMEAGPNVTLILNDAYSLPIACEEADIVISTSCFEHSEFFWLSFLEMARIVKPGGIIYVSAPTNGPVHRHPVDCWRFYPDAGAALARWAERKREPISLRESFILPPGRDGWSDFVGVWAKRPWTESPRLAAHFPTAVHVK